MSQTPSTHCWAVVRPDQLDYGLVVTVSQLRHDRASAERDAHRMNLQLGERYRRGGGTWAPLIACLVPLTQVHQP